jgi:glutathione S-transferase
MKLFYSKGACSLSPHIVLREAKIPFDLIKVDLSTHTTADGVDYYTINDKGYVPALMLDSGEVLTEGVAIVQYLADQVPDMKLVPANGTFERYKTQEWLTFISSEIHKTFSSLFNPHITEDAKKNTIEKIKTRLAYVDKKLAGKTYAFGDTFSIVDAYLFTIVSWSSIFSIDLNVYPNLSLYMTRIGERPAVKEAMASEQ